LSCVIISYVINKEVCVAVVYDPYADELFSAIRGNGAFLKTGNQDATRISVSTTKSIQNAVISMDPGYGRDKIVVQRYCAIQTALLTRSVRNLRVIGCTGLNMAWVACGRLDGGFEEGSWEANCGPKIWDFAAGCLLISEAGGITRDLESQLDQEGSLNLMGRSFFCAATPALAKEILEGIVEGRSACGQE
jgi:myo-inositol-1(or 4)-monophosphatase